MNEIDQGKTNPQPSNTTDKSLYVGENVSTHGGDFVGRDKIEVNTIEGVGIAVGHGNQITIYGGINYFPIKLHSPLRRRFAPLIEDRTKLFAGRDFILGKIMQVVQNKHGGYLVITSPAGLGKTSLIANLIHKTPEAFAYHFFTPLYDSTNESSFLRNVVEQMAEWHDYREQLPTELDELRALYHQFIAQSSEKTRVLILDGLDEVNRWKLAPYLSRHLPDNLHIIATIRDVGQDWINQYEFPISQLTHLKLIGLDKEGVAGVLAMAGGSAVKLANDSSSLNEIMRISAYSANMELGADPFYIRLLAEDAAVGKLNAQNLTSEPHGLDHYLGQWVESIIEATDADNFLAEATLDLLGTLTIAVAPVPRVDLEAINKSLIQGKLFSIFPRVIRAIRRFVSGNDASGYALMHPRLQEFMKEHPDIRIDEYRSRMLEYCTKWAEHGSNYVLAHFAEQLKDAGKIDSLFTLINRNWMDYKFKNTFSHKSFANDLDIAIEAAFDNVTTFTKPEDNFKRLACYCLLYSTLRNLATNVPIKALGVLVHLGQVDKALGYAELSDEQDAAYKEIAYSLAEVARYDEALETVNRIEDIEMKAMALAELAFFLGRSRESAKAQLIMDQAFDMIKDIQFDDSKSEILSAIALAMATNNSKEQAVLLIDQSLELAKKSGISDKIAFALNFVTKAMAYVGRLAEAISLIEVYGESWQKAEMLSNITFGLALAGHTQSVFEIAKLTEKAIRAIDDVGAEVYSLHNIAMSFAIIGEKERAIETSRSSHGNNQGDIEWMCDLAQVMVHVGENFQADRLLGDILNKVQVIDEWSKAGVFAALASTLADIHNFHRAIEIANLISDPYIQSRLLNHVGESLAKSKEAKLGMQLAEKVLSIAEQLTDDYEKDSVLASTALVIALTEDFESAFTLLNSLEDSSSSKVETLEKIIAYIFDNPNLNHNMIVSQFLLPSIKSLSAKYKKTDLLNNIAHAFIKMGDLGNAENIAIMIEDTESKDRMLNAIVKAYLLAGNIKGAQQIIAKVTDLGIGVAARGQIALSLIETGNIEQALDLIKIDVEVRFREFAHGPIAIAAIKSNYSEKVSHIIEKLTAPQPKNEENLRRSFISALFPFRFGYHYQIIDAFVDTNQIDQALNFSTEIADEVVKLSVLIRIASKLFNSGSREQAVQLAESILEKIIRLADDYAKACALLEFAEILFKCNERRRAISIIDNLIEIIDKFADESAKLDAMIELVRVLYDFDERELAIKNVELLMLNITVAQERENLSTPSYNLVTINLDHLIRLLNIFIKADEREKVTEIGAKILEIVRPRRQWIQDFHSLRETALRLAEYSEDELAISMAHLAIQAGANVGGSYGIMAELEKITRSLIESDLLNCALRIVMTISDRQRGLKLEALYVIAKALDAKGQSAIALWVIALAFNIARYGNRSDVFEVVQKGAATLGKWDQGEILWGLYQSLLEIDNWWEAAFVNTIPRKILRVPYENPPPVIRSQLFQLRRKIEKLSQRQQ